MSFLPKGQHLHTFFKEQLRDLRDLVLQREVFMQAYVPSPLAQVFLSIFTRAYFQENDIKLNIKILS